MPKLSDCLKVKVDRNTQAKRLRWQSPMEQLEDYRKGCAFWASLNGLYTEAPAKDPNAQG